MLIDNEPIRIAVEKANLEGISSCEICRKLNWRQCSPSSFRYRGRFDTVRLHRTIGKSFRKKNGKFSKSKKIKYETAVEIIKAINYDPVDFDL